MNSIFNSSSNELKRMDADELVHWIHVEGFNRMPPIVRVLTERLEKCLDELSEEDERRAESNKELKEGREELDSFLLKARTLASDLSGYVETLDKTPENREILRCVTELWDYLSSVDADNFIP